MQEKSLSRKQFIMAASACLLLAGCSDSGQEDAGSLGGNEQQGKDAQELTPVDMSSTAIDLDKVWSVGVFSEGLASIKYVDSSDPDTTWLGYVDKSGVMQFKFDLASMGQVDGEAFENNIAYLSSGPDEYNREYECCAIDKDGNILGEFKNVLAHGGGYVITDEYNEGFESSSYTYHVQDVQGNEVNTFNKDGNEGYGVHYFGKGIFGFGGNFFAMSGSSSFYPEFFYLSESNSTVPVDIDYSTFPNFDNGSDKALLGNETVDSTLCVYLLSKDGTIETVNIGDYDALGGNIRSITLNDNICSMKTNEKMLSYDITNGELHDLAQNYFDALDHYASAPTYSCGRFVMELKGADENKYVGIFDSAWNPIVDPFKVDEETETSSHFQDDRLTLANGTNSHADIYDTSGKLVCSIEADSGDGIATGLGNGYGDDVIFVRDGGLPRAFDTSGAELFNEITNPDAPVRNE